MQRRNSFTLEEKVSEYLATKKNKSAYINNLVKEDINRQLEEAIASSNLEEAEDEEYLKELSKWDSTIKDGDID